MTLEVKITGDNSGFAEIQDKALLTSIIPYPPLDVANKIIPFIGSLTVGGDGVTSDLTVDGSVTPVDAFIGPPVFGDLYLTTANVLIADTGALSLNRFGSINGGLANGIGFFIETENERLNLSVSLKTNFDFIRVGTLTVGTGGKSDAYQLASTDTSNNDGYNPVLDFTKVSPVGIRLRADTQDKLGILISDDISGVATFNIIINGFIRIS